MPEKQMTSHARVVVIGAGIASCSTLYHLTREGWSDVVLVERDELTSGGVRGDVLSQLGGVGQGGLTQTKRSPR